MLESNYYCCCYGARCVHISNLNHISTIGYDIYFWFMNLCLFFIKSFIYYSNKLKKYFN